jgi:uncharacterized protein (DUF1330 family)
MSISPEQSTIAGIANMPDEPFVMLNLLEYTDDGGEAYDRYAENTVPLVQKRGGKMLYRGIPLADTESGHWDSVGLVFYPSPSAFLDMVQSSEYQAGIPHRNQGLKRTMVYAFGPVEGGPPLEEVATQGGDEIFVLNLLRFEADGGREEYQKYGNVVGPMILERGGAPVIVLKGLLPVVSEETWEDLYLVRYPTLAALQEMVSTDAWQKANVDRERGLDLTWAFPTQP